jgi:hypothetical protein
MEQRKQLECRIVITHRRCDLRTEVGMYDPLSGRYEFLGIHGGLGPAGQREVDKVIRDLKTSIERAGHRLTFCERSV